MLKNKIYMVNELFISIKLYLTILKTTKTIKTDKN